jgi:hypothetical protein
MSAPSEAGEEVAAAPAQENVLELGSLLSGVLLKRLVPVAVAIAAVIVVLVLVL